MNPKPIKDWSYDDLLTECAWVVVQAITKGEPLKHAMVSVDNLTTNWRKENGVTLDKKCKRKL